LNEKLYNKCKSKGLNIKHAAEVGVYLPETSNILKFIEDGINATLVEADPDYVLKIKEYFRSFGQVRIYPFAVWDKSGFITLNKASSSSFVDGLSASPAIVNDKYISDSENKITVEAKIFSEIDDGTIDLLSVDIEGGEWFVIKHLISKPDVISIETHWKNYTNPYLKEINEWMNKNGYKIWYIDKSDTVYFKDNLFTLTPLEKIGNKIKGK
jgi:FkbM family methyltransferase